MNITESIKFDKLQEENETLKKELAEKDKEIKKMKNDFIPLYEWVESQSDYLEELKQQQLYKEDFYLFCEKDEITYDWESLQTDEITIEMHLKYCESNNHRYCLIKDINNLPSKEDKNMYLVIKDSDSIKDIDEYLAKKFKELQEKPWNEIIEKYVEDKFGYTVANNLSDINWEKQSDKNIEPVR